MEQLLEQAQLVGSPDEGRLRRRASVAAAQLGHDPDRTPGRDREGLPLELLLGHRVEDDRPRRGPARRLADEHAAGRSGALEAGCGVDDVTGDDALARRAHGHSTLARRDPSPGGKAEPERANPFDKLQRRSHRPFGVILLRNGRAPDRHHGVADELLNGPAMPADHGTRQVDVARERVADLLRVPVLGKRREADEVDEQDRDQAALRDRTTRRRRGARRSRSALDGLHHLERPAACPAEPIGGITEEAAGRTGGIKQAAAARTEPVPGLALGTTAGTGHDDCLTKADRGSVVHGCGDGSPCQHQDHRRHRYPGVRRPSLRLDGRLCQSRSAI